MIAWELSPESALWAFKITAATIATNNALIIDLASSAVFAVDLVARGGDPVEIKLPHQEILAACLDHGIFHAQLARKSRNGLPAHVGMFDIGFLVELEEIELLIADSEELTPAFALQAEPALVPHHAIAIARDIGALSAGVGDDTFEPVAVGHQPFPSGPSDLGRIDGARGAAFFEGHADMG